MPYVFNPLSGQFDYYQTSSSTAIWLPSNLSSLVLWLDANKNVSTSGSSVTSWASRDANGFTFSQGTGSAQPALVTGQINNLPIVRFNGSTTYMVADLSNTALIPNGSFDIIMVMKFNGFIGNPNYQCPLGLPDQPSGGNSSWILLSNDASYGDISIGGNLISNPALSGSFPIDSTSYHTFRITYNGSGFTTVSNFTFYQDSIAKTGAVAGAYGGGTSFPQARIGANPAASPTYFLNADVAAVFTFNEILSAQNLSLMKSFINTTYGI